jgi:hypothetical protein
MSLLGKILAIMNVLLAIVVLVLANIDWGTQQGWNYALLKRQLLIRGLPVDEKEAPQDDPDEPLVRELSGGVLNDLFQGNNGGSLGGAPVKTVADELNRVKAKLTGDVANQADDNAKRNLLKGVLYPLARTLSERDEMRANIDGENGVNWGQREIERRFDGAKLAPRGDRAARRDFRANAAFLLGNLSQDPEWRKRVMTVVGLEAYIDGLSRQAEAMSAMAHDIYVAMNTDRAKFEEDYNGFVNLLTRESEQIAKAKNYLAELDKIKSDREVQVKQRQAEKTQAETDLAAARRDTQKEIAQLKAIQTDLFNLQNKYKQAMDKNQGLETELRQLEQNKR